MFFVSFKTFLELTWGCFRAIKLQNFLCRPTMVGDFLFGHFVSLHFKMRVVGPDFMEKQFLKVKNRINKQIIRGVDRQAYQSNLFRYNFPPWFSEISLVVVQSYWLVHQEQWKFISKELICFISIHFQVILTGGEDGIICSWLALPPGSSEQKCEPVKKSVCAYLMI